MSAIVELLAEAFRPIHIGKDGVPSQLWRTWARLATLVALLAMLAGVSGLTWLAAAYPLQSIAVTGMFLTSIGIANFLIQRACDRVERNTSWSISANFRELFKKSVYVRSRQRRINPLAIAQVKSEFIDVPRPLVECVRSQIRSKMEKLISDRAIFQFEHEKKEYFEVDVVEFREHLLSICLVLQEIRLLIDVYNAKVEETMAVRQIIDSAITILLPCLGFWADDHDNDHEDGFSDVSFDDDDNESLNNLDVLLVRSAEDFERVNDKVKDVVSNVTRAIHILLTAGQYESQRAW